MLVYLCDECHAPLKPEEASEPGASVAGRMLCRACRARHAPAPTPPAPPRPSCDGCQVAESQGAVPGGSFGDRSNIFCATCERIAATPGTKFRCHACKAQITIQEIRAGTALTEGEKAFCSTCKRRVAAPPPPGRVEPPLRAASPPGEKRADSPAPSPAPPPAPSPAAAPPAGPPLPPPEPTGSEPLQCDFCRRAFALEDLRTGKAEIRDARVLCPRCVARLDRSKQRIDFRFAASLAFVLVVFPLAAAILLFVAFGGRGDRKQGPDAGNAEKKGAGARDASFPDWGGAAQNPPADPPAPSAGKQPKPPAEGSVRGIPRDDLDQILRNLREPARRPGTPAPTPVLGDPLPDSRAPHAPEDTREAEKLLGSPDPAVRLEGILRVANGSPGAPLLVKALEDSDPFVRSTAAASLGRRGDASAIGPLLARIRDPDLEVRRTASRSLLDLAGIRFRPVEDMTAEELEQAKKMIEKALEQKQGK